MNVLVISAHPLANSLCLAFADRICSRLTENGHTVVLDDLYESNFNPVLTAEERKSYYERTYDATHVGRQIRNLLDAEAVVLVFPTWWFGFPAILKGWFDRVWAPTVAYDHADDFGPIKPRLEKLKNALVITTLGAPWWVDAFILRKPLKRIIKHALLGACTKKCKLNYLSFYKCEKVHEIRMRSFLRRIDAALDQWLN